MISERIGKALNSRNPRIIAENGHKPAAVLVPIQERLDGQAVEWMEQVSDAQYGTEGSRT